MGDFFSSSSTRVDGSPVLRLLRPFRHFSFICVIDEGIDSFGRRSPPSYFPSVFASLEKFPVFNMEDSNEML